jgi:hypothetical protein
MRYEDLPPALKARVDASIGKPAKTRRQSTEPCPGHCACGESFASYGRWEKHSDAEGHRRWSVL